MIDYKATGIQIRKIMDEKGVSVREVQDFLQLESVQAIYNWLYGQSLPTVSNLFLLAELLDVKMDDLIVGETTKN